MEFKVSVCKKNITLTSPRGFCAGVKRAISIVEKAIDIYGPQIYVNHEIVHNKHVINYFKDKGVIFVDNIIDVPEGMVIIFSAHGVSKDVISMAKKRKLLIIDATCPLVTKVHLEVLKMRRENREVIIIGHKNHPEVNGTLGQDTSGIYIVESVSDVLRLKVNDNLLLGYVTQTTLSIDDVICIEEALKNRFPMILGPKKSDICYATQNRQNALKHIVKECDLILIAGSANSSNSNRLLELAIQSGVESYLIDSFNSIDLLWLHGKKHIGITSGASAPEVIVDQIVEFLKRNGFGDDSVNFVSIIEENISFPLPKFPSK
ncbi:4-hydroxy-3-methylbut-2-enyl diphosphate reductase [Candidatus Kinetoplastibacterium blastocrithidii TCC012E]|uniref:4-hydroxy-3-methylbut-2-enyl diphosphate reductase n=1 Tax=Candidatus Kinetoplastidibacterium blastocrithidiae TCC012E TaxID=1208922 RepID=M1LWD9_9PROT|nr:4-hydroxy-3-methylbut-2-enyl diphosphate reductase [Candidatus Kinetoplastibacterium blastocrithidii]AFZ83719.1 4-hydroxy-3-methylbut-2-enyl diphosphate reductase [Candidatus Kinetoplastibacterium blastocrithidii (ex Strigomonas culicis)]AGF49842.1 4-hydroxy-3-methylbut-2-enyl diphosphate reductase [Candidatus Kinetoplastibacterium blastocrithidii TCC012E]